MSANAKNKVREYKSSNFGSMTTEELFSHIQEDIGFNTVTIKAAEKLYDDIKRDIIYQTRLEIIGACIRAKSIDKGQPIRIKKICDLLEIDSKDVVEIGKKIKRENNIKMFPDPKEYGDFLLERLDVNSISKKKMVRDKIEEARDNKELVGKPSTSIGIAVVSIETDIKHKKIAKEVSTSTSTIRNNRKQVKKALSDDE